MYGNGAVQPPQGRAVSTLAADRPTVATTHQETISRLKGISESLRQLLAKVRGAQPEKEGQCIEEMPSVMSNAAKLNSLAFEIEAQVRELHEVIGE